MREDTVTKIVKHPKTRRLKKEEALCLMEDLKDFFWNYLFIRPDDPFFTITETKLVFNVHCEYLEMILVGATLNQSDDIILITKNIRDRQTYFLQIV